MMDTSKKVAEIAVYFKLPVGVQMSLNDFECIQKAKCNGDRKAVDQVGFGSFWFVLQARVAAALMVLNQ